MSRDLIQLNIWLLGSLMVIGIPLLAVVAQAAIRRVAPGIVAGEHNDVAGFLIAVVGVVYAVTLAFIVIVIVTWEEFRSARDTVSHEAGSLRSLYRDSRILPEPARTRMGDLVIGYAREVSVGEWRSMDQGEPSRAAFDIVGEMFSTLGGVTPTTSTEETFLADALVRLNEVTEDRAARITVAEEGPVSILWAAILIGGVLTLGFALLFGVSDERLHFLMVGGFAAVLALQIFVILVLSLPFSGDVRVTPEPFQDLIRDFGR